MAVSDNSQWVTEADKKRDTVRMAMTAPSAAPDEPVQLTQIRQWEAGELYPEHETFSFGHGFGAAVIEELDARAAENARLRDLLANGVKLLRHVYGSKAGFASAAEKWLAEVEPELRKGR